MADKKPHDHKRSGHWPTFRKKLIKGKACAVCGGKKKLELHHIIPFHIDPTKELDETNVIVLCEGSKFVNCHLLVGHLGSYRSYNKDAVEDAKYWYNKIHKRPK